MEYNLIYEAKEFKVPFIRDTYIVSLCSKLTAVALERGPELISIIYSLYKQKIPYFLIDTSLPKERIEYMLELAHINTVITQKRYLQIFNKIDQILCIDQFPTNPNLYYKTAIPPKENDIGYLIFTSGSSGYPKGVEVKRSGIDNFIYGVSEIIDFAPGKKIASFTSISFDIFFLESIMALELGLIVVLSNDGECKNPAKMAEFIEKHKIDMLQMTPSRFQMLWDFDRELRSLNNVKEIMLGGETLPYKMLKILQNKTKAKIYNMYGPTETTIWSTIADLTHSDNVHIGKPIHATEVYIIDDDFTILKEGQAGEICIAGKGLANGYIGQPNLTMTNFTTLMTNILVYKTGDQGCFLPDGNLQFIGRRDNQLKIHGYRIELEEIESVADQFDGITKSIVITSNSNTLGQILTLIYKSTQIISEVLLKRYMKSKLPQYMVPTQYVRCEDFVYNNNGKIDRKHLYKTFNDQSNSSIDEVKELSPQELGIFALICEFVQNSEIDVTSITVDSELESIGLTSFSFIRLVVHMEQNLHIKFDDQMLEYTEFPNIHTLIAYTNNLLNPLTDKT